MTRPSAIEVPAFQNILQYTADFIFGNFKDRDADFSEIFVFLPHSRAAKQFNNILGHATGPGLPAIIPPWAGTFRAWARRFSRSEHADRPIISEYSRQLLFIEALQEHPDLFKEENQWQVTQALLSLFDELSLNQLNLFTSADEWQQQLQQAYGIDNQHQHLLYESRLVYTLWYAWQQQLDENNYYDETSDLLSRLTNAAQLITAPIKAQQYFICLDFSQYSMTEQAFINTLVENNQCRLIEFESTLQPGEHQQHVFADFIGETFKQPSEDKQASFKQRAEQFAEKHPGFSVKDLPFSVYLAASEEEQIRAIDYYIRLNIINGKNNIAVISEDRKLSRRLRALLERANIQLQDNAGWSLATTQAASIIERWLECIEEDFSAYPLLDCLKSPFINITHPVLGEQASEEDFKKNIYRFEHDLVFHENISSNIKQYKASLKARLHRLSHWPAKSYDELVSTLNYIENTAKPLTGLYAAANKSGHSGGDKIPLTGFLDALLTSLQQLGVIQRYRNDEAGLKLLNTFEQLKQSLKFSNPALSWFDCRTWLGMALESQHFTPSTNNAIVQLMTLEQSSHLDFDCIVIAGVEPQHYPGSANDSPFFNQAVRVSLGLKTWEEQRRQRHELFNRVLLAAPDILLTACNEEKGEAKPVSPWLELLINFYQLAHGDKDDISLYNNYLKDLFNSNYEVFNCDERALPKQSSQPSPALPGDLIPQRISASGYQRIINCPYQYFSADGLGLKPLEELSDELKKSDYGERIHLILQSFHGGHKKYGKAFDQTITQANRQQAEDYLVQLSEKVFVADMENNVLHRSWLYRWKKHIPSYINWQIQHQGDWNIYLSEKHVESELVGSGNEILHDAVTLYGRLDRIDQHRENNTHAIIDYKTGRTASQEDVDSGENVQLSSYALLDPDASEVSYLSVDSSDRKVQSKSSLAGEELQINREENKQRLLTLFKQMKNSQTLPAWGDDSVCSYCDFSGLCRKQQWG
ncbi:MAG: PD-(D/E)XK nuclease family protein [Gammaproteobacteria bacterium]|nr:PD-(D/E)XK nuclease family protein [Gammaproteobacteria bacterium]